MVTGANYGYWKRQEERWAAMAEGAPDETARDYIYGAFEKSSQALAGLEKALLALGLLEQAKEVNLRSPHQDFFDPIWRRGWRTGDLVRIGSGEEGSVDRGSAAGLRELMTNLIFNAVDALPTGGTIRLRVVAEDGQGVIEIIDSGVGMSAEVQKRVFEPFFTTKGEGGTGLGLAMVFGIVEQHGGHIEVRSVPEVGTTFRITFTLLDALVAANPSPRASHHGDVGQPAPAHPHLFRHARVRQIVRTTRNLPLAQRQARWSRLQMAYLTVGYLSKVVVVATSPKTELRIVLAAVESPLAIAWERFCGDLSFVTVRRDLILDVATDAVVSPANSYGFMDGGKAPAYPLLSRTADGFAANCGT